MPNAKYTLSQYRLKSLLLSWSLACMILHYIYGFVYNVYFLLLSKIMFFFFFFLAYILKRWSNEVLFKCKLTFLLHRSMPQATTYSIHVSSNPHFSINKIDWVPRTLWLSGTVTFTWVWFPFLISRKRTKIE